jgi:hypothetical protein
MQIAITGCGWVTPLAVGDVATVLKAYAGRKSEAPTASNYEPIPPGIFATFTNLSGEAAKEEPVQLAAVALELAWQNAGLDSPSYASECKGLVLGSALAGVSGMIDFANDVRAQSTRFVSPIRFPQTVGNYICGALARCYDFRGPASTIACGSASSLEAIREGCALLSSRQADVVIAGGTELLSPEIAEGFNQPDVRFADGACLFVLESEDAAQKRGATILASIPNSDLHEVGQAPLVNQMASVAGYFEPGAISIEKWTGRTLGADGAAAVAAAIGSSMGLTVPRDAMTSVDKADAEKVSDILPVTANHIGPRQKMIVQAATFFGDVHRFALVIDKPIPKGTV